MKFVLLRKKTYLDCLLSSGCNIAANRSGARVAIPAGINSRHFCARRAPDFHNMLARARAKNAGYCSNACPCIPSRCFRVDSSTCSRTRSSQPLPPCHISPTWWLRIGRLHTKQIAVMVLKKGSARCLKPLGKKRRDEVTSPPASWRTEELSTEEEGASLNDKITWNQAMPTERSKVTIHFEVVVSSPSSPSPPPPFSKRKKKYGAIATTGRDANVKTLLPRNPGARTNSRRRRAGYCYVQVRASSWTFIAAKPRFVYTSVGTIERTQRDIQDNTNVAKVEQHSDKCTIDTITQM